MKPTGGTSARPKPPGLIASAIIAVLGIATTSACRPHIRFGHLEPPAGGRALVDAHVRPAPEEAPDPRLAGASGDPTLADAAFAAVPVIGIETVVGELGSNLQGLDTSAADAPVEPAELGVDARRIESIYAAYGYFRARTLAWRIVDLDDSRTRVEYDVVEGEPTRVVKVVFEGLNPPEDDSEAATILADIWRELPDLALLSEGAIWTENDYLLGLAAIRRAFRDAGFVQAEVTGDSFVSQDVPRAVVHYRIDHGRLARSSGDMIIFGEKIVPAERIRLRAEFAKGAILSASELRDAEQRIFELGQFLFVQIRPVRGSQMNPAADESSPRTPVAPPPLTPPEPPPPADPDTTPPSADAPTTPLLNTPMLPALDAARLGASVDMLQRQGLRLEIEVQEAPEWEFNVGFGARTDSTQLSLEVPIGFNHRDLFGELVTLRTEARPALVFPDAFTQGADDLRVGMNARALLSVPSFFEEYLKFNVSANYRRDVTQAAGVEEFSGAIDWSRRLGPYLSVRTGWNFSYTNFFDRSIFGVLPADVAIDQLALRLLRTDMLAWLGASIAFDSRDGIFEAKSGVFATLGFDVAETWLGSFAPFERLTFEGRAYLTLPDFDILTLAIRVRAGAVFHRDRIGSNESARLKSGGQSSMRGFAANRMGQYVCVKGVDEGSVIDGGCSSNIIDRLYIGGNYLFEANAELRLSLGSLGLVGFIDVGQLWNRASDIAFNDLRVAVGPGLRFQTPIGPLRADLGFLLGATPSTEFHIGLGQAF